MHRGCGAETADASGAQLDVPLNALALDASGQPLTTDQRGYLRIYNGRVDIGAVEFQPQFINGTSGNDSISLVQDSNHQQIDWTLGASAGSVPLWDPAGVFINGGGGSDTIALDNSNASPLPHYLHLNGIFSISGMSSSNPLASTMVEIGRSTVFISYTSSDPLSLIQGYLKNGYNNGAWNGAPTTSTGVIISTPAAQNAAQTTGIGWADSADGLIAGQPANTIELKYTLYGDTRLAGSVGFNDFTRMTQHWNQTTGGTWDTGDFNYDSSVNSGDFTLVSRTYNTSLGSQAMPAASAAAAAAAATSPTAPIPTPKTPMPSLHVKPLTPAHYHKAVRKHKKHH